MKSNQLLLLLVIFVSLIFISDQDTQAFEWQTLNEDLVLLPKDLATWTGDALVVDASGLTLADSASSGSFTSPPILSPFPFNAVGSQWLVDGAQDHGVELFLRSGSSETELGEWQEVHASHDMNLAEDAPVVGDLSFVPGALDTHAYVQIKVTLNREEEKAAPLLREVRLTFIDSTNGPTTEQLVEIQKALDKREDKNLPESGTSLDAYPKPFVLSRAVWCTSPACNYEDGLEYQPVSHLILHHTVGIPDGDSAAQVRAYWSYHTYTKQWGDIGYNFVIDLEGKIFEGHLGGDDVIGTHAGNANAGSMGVSMIGTYSTKEPSAAIKESIVDIFAWKADQRDIDVFDASDALPNMAWGLPHVMGHRDVYGTTECPGGEAHKLIPAIRDEVAKRIGLESPHIYVDELSSSFVKSNANWYTAASQCGHNTHAWYTWSTTDPNQAVNWGEWRPNVPENGRYRIEAHIPYCRTGKDETESAKYTITHATGTSEVVISHQENIGLWASLGEYTLKPGTSNVIHLTDLTTTDSGLGLWFDALRLLPVEAIPAAVIESPKDLAWLNKRQVPFQWSTENPDQVAQTTIQVAVDAGFQNLVASKQWSGTVESFTHTFPRDYGALYWRVIVKSNSGNDYPSAAGRFGIDTEPPVSSVEALSWLAWSKQYKVSWSGNDALNHIAHYEIEHRATSGDTSWKSWLKGTNSTSAHFAPPVPGLVYEFRSRATDSLGHVEATHPTADASTEQADSLSHAIILPVIYKK